MKFLNKIRMKNILLGLFIVFTNLGISQSLQPDYWQQKVKYEMNIDVDVNNNSYDGDTKITYYNNSPDTLRKVFFHLYFNAFKPGSQMDIRQQILPDPDRRIGDRISHLDSTEIGYQQIISLKQGRKELDYKVSGTIMEVSLNKVILPGSRTAFYLKNHAQIPIQIRRSGRDNSEGVKLSMTQWYPKVAEYDKEGWHTDNYISREFFGVYGTFDVKISIDKDYTIGGTGVLQNPQEIGHGYQNKNKRTYIPKTDKLEWHFVAKNVHDFAWGADNNYQHDIRKLNNKTDLHFLYLKGNKKRKENWAELQDKMIEAFKYINSEFGVYPYKQFSIVQAGDGGMEYPMSTLILGDGESSKGLVGLAIHETLHSWYYGVLGSNEQKYPWMDEGFTTWAENKTINHLYPKEGNPHKNSYRGYFVLNKSGKEQALTTKADWYDTNFAYSQASYSKGSVFIEQLAYIIGEENINKTMLLYFNTWKFKHPTPNSFKRVAEKVSGIQLQWYFDKWINTTQTIDYGIKKVTAIDEKTSITLDKIGKIPMPLDITVVFKDNEVKTFYIPISMMHGEKRNETKFERKTLKAWPWVYPNYTFEIEIKLSDIKFIAIDISDRMADVNKNNNYYPKQEFNFEGQ